ncbi:MAG: TadE family protein [Dehalococcoidia bacterium]
MRIRRPGSRRGERGQALVEFALVLPLLLIMLFGIIDFGRALQTYITINNASREGARFGSISPSGNIQQKVRTAAGDFGDDVTIVVSFPSGQDSGDSVIVDVDYEYQMITPLGAMLSTFTGGSLGTSIGLSSSSDMRLE